MSAFDLNRFRGPKGNPDQQQLMLDVQLQRVGLRCTCGARIEKGVKLIAVWKGVLAAPAAHGPEPRDIGVVTERAYCGRVCPEYLAQRQYGIPFSIDLGLGPQELVAIDVVATSDLPPVIWFDHE